MTPELDVTVDAPRTLSVEVTHAECFPIEPHLMWLLIGRFEDLSWLPGLGSFGWEGRIRRFSIAGRQFTERLDFLDAAARAYGYSLIDGPLAVTRYEAQITVYDDPAGCRVVMESSSDPAPGREFEIRRLLESTYATAMRGLRRSSERASQQAIASSQPSKAGNETIRHDWSEAEAHAIYQLPFPDLLHRAQSVHRRFFDPTSVQLCRLHNVKTGGCSEDCGYCSQSTKHNAGVRATRLADLDDVVREARRSVEAGATRYCMGAAWRSPKARDLDKIVSMIKAVKSLGLETCATLGMLTREQADQLASAGLDYYNHNIDTSEEFYESIVTTRTYRERLETLQHVRDAGIKVCCGGILGMGEEPRHRVNMIRTLANLPQHPHSVPINMLIPIRGTPLASAPHIDPIAFVRILALARVMMPECELRLSAGRSSMSREMHALCFLAGANSIFIGDKLLTASNPGEDFDRALMADLGLTPTVSSST